MTGMVLCCCAFRNSTHFARYFDALVHREQVAGVFGRLRRMRVEEPERLAAMQTAGRAVYERFEKLVCA